MNLGLLTGTSDALRIYDRLNDYFSGISISPHEDLENLQHEVQNVPLGGFFFQPVTENYVILKAYHFNP